MTFLEIIDNSALVEEKTKEMIEKLLLEAARYENKNVAKLELSLSFVDVKEIHSINKEYRNIDRPTDVISFALNDEVEGELEIIGGEDTDYIGDIIICVDIAREQAKDYGHSFERELGFLAVHGFLHLLGYDHMTEAEEKIMFSKQDKILETFGLLR